MLYSQPSITEPRTRERARALDRAAQAPHRSKEVTESGEWDVKEEGRSGAPLAWYTRDYALLGVTAAVGGGSGRRRSRVAVAVAGRRLGLGRRRRPLGVVAIAAARATRRGARRRGAAG